MPRDSKHPEGVSIHTGFPNPATDQRLQTLDFNQLLIRHSAATFMFRIEGKEWESLGIFNNDIAVIDRSLNPKKTDTVIWWDEADGTFAISNYPDVPEQASVWGVVTASIHQFRND